MALDDRYVNQFALLDSTIIYPKSGHKLLYTPMTDKMKCPTNIPLPFAFYSISSNVDATHASINHKWYNPLHIIVWPYWFINLDITWSSPLPSSIDAKSCSSFTATRSIAPKPPTCPLCLQPVHRAKSCFYLLHLSHMTQCHVSYVMSSLITCVSLATYPSHFTSMA